MNENFRNILQFSRNTNTITERILNKENQMNKRPTYRMIADATGVSQATISRVLTGRGNVSEEMRETVVKALDGMGYDINQMERPKPKADKLLVFNIPTIENPFYSLLVTGARDSAERNGYALLVNSHELAEKEEVDQLLLFLSNAKAAGLIIANSVSRETLQRLSDSLPTVQCCECIENSQIPFVTIDDVAAARKAVEHLLSLGKRRIAFLNGSLSYKYARGRLAGYRLALSKAGIPINEDLIIPVGEINYDMALSATYQLLNSPSHPDGFFTTSDVYAAAVIKAVRRSGLSIPDDVAVVGFDNIEISSMCIPSITTVNQPRYQMGLVCCDMLVEKINNGKIPLKNMYLETELIVRESTTKSHESTY